MTALDFMDGHPVASMFLAWIVVHTAFRCWNRLLRHLNIRAHGWPPAHCDADGDFAPAAKDGNAL